MPGSAGCGLESGVLLLALSRENRPVPGPCSCNSGEVSSCKIIANVVGSIGTRCAKAELFVRRGRGALLPSLASRHCLGRRRSAGTPLRRRRGKNSKSRRGWIHRSSQKWGYHTLCHSPCMCRNTKTRRFVNACCGHAGSWLSTVP